MESYAADLARFHGINPAAGGVPAVAAQGRLHPEGEDRRLREVTQEFEALFVKQMLDAMRATRDTDSDMLHGGMAEDFFEDMLYTEYAKIMAKTGDFGLGEVLYRELASR